MRLRGPERRASHAGECASAHRLSGEVPVRTIETAEFGGESPSNDVPPAPDPAAAPEQLWGICLMMLWPAVTLLGFLFLTALVIAMGTQSTARYEREQRAATRTGSGRPAAPEAEIGRASCRERV